MQSRGKTGNSPRFFIRSRKFGCRSEFRLSRESLITLTCRGEASSIAIQSGTDTLNAPSIDHDPVFHKTEMAGATGPALLPFRCG